jgi:hypothetical protein
MTIRRMNWSSQLTFWPKILDQGFELLWKKVKLSLILFWTDHLTVNSRSMEQISNYINK